MPVNACFFMLNIVDPEMISDLNDECIYLCGNSLGLQPKAAHVYQQEVLNAWETMLKKILFSIPYDFH